MTGFDPSQHRLAAPHFFEDLALGQRFPIPSRTMTDALFAAFQLASGDNHPIHYDRPYCQARGYRDLLAHGYQVLIQAAAGAGQFPHLVGDALVGFISQSSRFLAPVFAGDTLYPMLEIVELQPQRTTGVVVVRCTVHNQDGVLVMDGDQRYLLKRRVPAT
jgi:acyl dehydratase